MEARARQGLWTGPPSPHTVGPGLPLGARPRVGGTVKVPSPSPAASPGPLPHLQVKPSQGWGPPGFLPPPPAAACVNPVVPPRVPAHVWTLPSWDRKQQELPGLASSPQRACAPEGDHVRGPAICLSCAGLKEPSSISGVEL